MMASAVSYLFDRICDTARAIVGYHNGTVGASDVNVTELIEVVFKSPVCWPLMPVPAST
jgi:hypothetical protein